MYRWAFIWLGVGSLTLWTAFPPQGLTVGHDLQLVSRVVFYQSLCFCLANLIWARLNRSKH